EEVDFAHSLRRVVTEDALLRGRAQNRTGAPEGGRFPQLLVVHEEERFTPSVEARDHDRTAHAEPGLIAQELRLLDTVALVEPGIRVQLVAPVRVVHAAFQVVRSGPAYEADL